MKRLTSGSHVTLVQRGSDSPVCPRCGNNNAMLYNTSVGRTSILECRDCHVIVGVSESDHKTAVVISRSIGKTCSRCGSFEMKSVGNSMYQCQECSAPAVRY